MKDRYLYFIMYNKQLLMFAYTGEITIEIKCNDYNLIMEKYH